MCTYVVLHGDPRLVLGAHDLAVLFLRLYKRVVNAREKEAPTLASEPCTVNIGIWRPRTASLLALRFMPPRTRVAVRRPLLFFLVIFLVVRFGLVRVFVFALRDRLGAGPEARHYLFSCVFATSSEGGYYTS